MNRRDTFIDYLKGIAIILMLVGHCIQYGSGSVFLIDELYWENAVMKVIYSFHMPLFIAISGYLFWYSVTAHGMLTSIRDRMVRLIPVCFSWAVILCIVDIGKGVDIGLKRFILYFLTDFWFLWAIIFCVICVAVIEFAGKSFRGGILTACIVLLCLFLIVPDILNTHTYKYVAPYFVSGFYYAKYKRKWLNHTGVGIISAVTWIVLLQLYSKNSFIYTTGITIINKEDALGQMAIDGYRYLIGAVGVISVVWFTKKIYDVIARSKIPCMRMGKDGIEYMGRNSITYYILSTYLFIWVMPSITKGFSINYAVTLFETILMVVLCSVIGRLIKCSKIISKWLIAS